MAVVYAKNVPIGAPIRKTPINLSFLSLTRTFALDLWISNTLPRCWDAQLMSLQSFLALDVKLP